MIGSITKSVLSYGVPRTVRSIIPCRQANTLADDINQVVLLGRVNSVHLNEKSDKAYASIGLITKNTYKSSTGYSSKFAYHNVYVFSQPLFNKIRNLVKGDRLCVTGCLTSYFGANGQWRFSVTANSVSPYIMESTNDAIEGVEEEDINDEANVDEVAYEVLVYNVSEDTNNNTTVSPKVIVTKEDHIEN